MTKIKFEAAQIERLHNFISSGTAKAREIKHANVLLKLHLDWSYSQIAQAFDLSERTVIRLKKRCQEEGLEAALVDKPRSGAPKKLDGPLKALVIATTCSTPPPGHQRWTLRLVADRMVELEAIPAISHSSVGRILKKTS